MKEGIRGVKRSMMRSRYRGPEGPPSTQVEATKVFPDWASGIEHICSCLLSLVE
jgi:hypothetical protein